MEITPDELHRVAEQFGFSIEDELAPELCAALTESLVEVESYLERTGEAAEGIDRHADRDPRLPDDQEDPLNLWRWRCEARGAQDGPLAGTTVALKDNIALAGVPMTFATRALDDHVPDFDAALVSRILAAGGVITGKTMLDGLSGGMGNGNGPADYGPVLNPHAGDHLSGGSSSGSAAAVVAGEVDVAIGGDQSGSIRIPAAWCGAIGLKPTFGLVSHHGVGYDIDPTFDHVGPIARTARLVATTAQVIAGRDGSDPRQGADCPESIDLLTGLEDGVAGLRIGLLAEGFAGVSPGVAAAVRGAVGQFERLGAQVREVSLPSFEASFYDAMAVIIGGSRMNHLTTIAGFGHVGPYPESLITAVDRVRREDSGVPSARRQFYVLLDELARQRHGPLMYVRGQNRRHQFRAAVDQLLSECDVLALPTMLTTAPRRPPIPGRLDRVRSTLGSPLRPGGVIRNTVPFSYSGHPALAVPCGLVDGLPASLQLVSEHYGEATLVRAARALEQVDPELTAPRPPAR